MKELHEMNPKELQLERMKIIDEQKVLKDALFSLSQEVLEDSNKRLENVTSFLTHHMVRGRAA